MKAAVVCDFGVPLEITELPVPEVGPGQVLVRVHACGVCHTDLHAADGDWPVKPPLPFVPGHEGVGVVATLGQGVTRLREGDRVGVPWLHTACGHCEHCLTGWETLCDHQQMTGYTVNGGYAEYVLADANYVGRLPDGLDFAPAAPILCAGALATGLGRTAGSRLVRDEHPRPDERAPGSVTAREAEPTARRASCSTAGAVIRESEASRRAPKRRDAPSGSSGGHSQGGREAQPSD